MYIPQHFSESRVEVMHALMQAHPLATLVMQSSQGLNANHIPLHLQPGQGPFGTLRGHIAKANPMLGDMQGEASILAIFLGPQSYISPNWYPSKQVHGKAVPTWNYAAVHAHGKVRVIEDAAWLHSQVEALSAEHEARFEYPWKVADAPADYIDKMLNAIVGIEIEITRLEGKWKVSQNQPEENRQGVIAGLSASGQLDDQAMAKLIAPAQRPTP
jgi:transcriptional regulator